MIAFDRRRGETRLQLRTRAIGTTAVGNSLSRLPARLNYQLQVISCRNADLMCRGVAPGVSSFARRTIYSSDAFGSVAYKGVTMCNASCS